MANNKEIAQNVLNAVGGAANVKLATHCMTRLRFNLVDESIPKDEEVRNLPGVLGVARVGGQYQVIIGPQVAKVYNEVCALGGFAQAAPVEENPDGPAGKEKLTLNKAGKSILNYLSGCMTPMIPVLLAGGLCRTVNALCGPDLLNLYSAESDIYTLFNFLFEAGLYFMPILVGLSAAKILGINQMLGAYIGCILIAPSFVSLAEAGAPFTVFGIPCTLTNYGQTVIPVMLSVFLFSLVYKVVQKYMPDILAAIFTPFVSVLISTPVILCLLAPLGTIVGNYIGVGLAVFGSTTGFLGVAVISALWEFLVMSGMHLALMMPMMASFFETGVMTGPTQAGCFATWACFGVALGAALRLRKYKNGPMALGAFVSGILGTVTEPTLYGLCFRYKRCFLGLVAGGFIGGAYAGLMNVCTYVMSSGNFLSLLGFTGGSTSNLINGIISCMLAMGSAAAITFLFGFTKEELNGN